MDVVMHAIGRDHTVHLFENLLAGQADVEGYRLGAVEQSVEMVTCKGDDVFVESE